MKKLILTLTALTLATSALANPKAQTLTWDEYGCTPEMSFKKGKVYTVNYEKRWQEVQQYSEFDENAWLFTIKSAHRTSVKLNGKFPKNAGAGQNAYFAHPKKGDNKIEIVKPFKGMICFNGAG